MCVILFSCKSTSNNYKIEKRPTPEIEKAYYQDWASGIKGGGAGYSVYLFFKENTNITIEGIYFKNKYSKIKFQGKNKYQAFVKNNENLEKSNMDDTEPIKKEDKLEKIPFELKGNEAVISYIENEQKRFMKITLNKNENMDLPM
ncbi:hypothetical protein [Polaribacter porphyrae]|uniref:Uncharacterized protein n=1 Tax=Polaribacter porphyrae TaxID=1137780 RepID=A0A2S7WS83_9FLAO|nr:hypothetical protein [Polaribacter porphyrae]PQJ80457.1 hypothetical protein BTO18_15315 [Polaribacter porphyrae]